MLRDGQDLGSSCAADATSTGDNKAVARVPCNSAIQFYLYSPSLYTLEGRRRSQAWPSDPIVRVTPGVLGAVTGLLKPEWLRLAVEDSVPKAQDSESRQLPHGLHWGE